MTIIQTDDEQSGVSDAKLLTPPTNYAVVQLPQRHFPGIVFQGDSLNSLIGELEEAIAETDQTIREEALLEILNHLRSVQSSYEAVLSKANLSLPYHR